MRRPAPRSSASLCRKIAMPSAPQPAGVLRLAWSNLAAQSAEQIALAAAPLVAVTALGAGAAETSILQAALTLPFFLFAVPAGLLADRLSRRRLMVGAESLRKTWITDHPGGATHQGNRLMPRLLESTQRQQGD